MAGQQSTAAVRITARTKAKQGRSFVVKETHKIARVKARWRFPRGRHSAVRQMHRGRPPLPTPGYGTPTSIRGLHSSGLRKIVIHTERELHSVNAATHGAVIGSTVGIRRRLALLKYAREQKIPVLNVRSIEKEITSLTDAFERRKREKQARLQTQARKDEEKKKKAEEKKKKEESEKKETSVEEKIKKEEEQQQQQRELAEKTITKKT